MCGRPHRPGQSPALTVPTLQLTAMRGACHYRRTVGARSYLMCCTYAILPRWPQFHARWLPHMRHALAGLTPGVKCAARRKLRHELGIDASEVPSAKFKFLTRLHYWAADVVTHGKVCVGVLSGLFFFLRKKRKRKSERKNILYRWEKGVTFF